MHKVAKDLVGYGAERRAMQMRTAVRRSAINAVLAAHTIEDGRGVL